MNKLEQLYEGKAKKVYSTEDPNVVIVSYKDDATAFDGAKKGTITGKGAINNQMTNYLMQQLEGLHCPPGGHRPQYLCRPLCQQLRREGGHRV